jgi:2-polyprenyl-3-methyl-5-hydroxy-6-metoxy-1,4-benzoquinol methylase
MRLSEEGEEDRLIFVLSLPRSGSTLLQHLFAAHPAVAATAEPWVLLPGPLALQRGALTADYDTEAGRIALTEFLRRLAGGDDAYYAALRAMARLLYDRVRTQEGKEWFVDKTSRYYLLIPELFRIFPRAKYVFLVRNPLAMFASFLDSMVQGDWRSLSRSGIRQDLLEGYRRMRSGIRYFGDSALVVRYEDIVARPEESLRRLCAGIGLVYHPSMLNYGKKGVLPGRLVDPKSIHRHHTVVGDYADAWKERLSSGQDIELARGFIGHLGHELIDWFGYSFADLQDVLNRRQPRVGRTAPWWTVMTPQGSRTLAQRLEVEFAYVWPRNGRLAAMRSTARLLYREELRPLAAAAARLIRRVPARLGAARLLARDVRKSSHQGPSQHSSDYRLLGHEARFSREVLTAWQAPSVAAQQQEAYQPLLAQMREGRPRSDFKAAAQALRLTNCARPTVLEIGCGNGYYSEILAELTGRDIVYLGLDSSASMIQSARGRYSTRSFVVGDALALPFPAATFDVAWSGTVLMHLPDYAKAIAEAARVATRYCVFHSTPLLAKRPTTFLTKRAYGQLVPEVIINRGEFEGILRSNALEVSHVLDSLPYSVDKVVGDTVETLTYVCRKRT